MKMDIKELDLAQLHELGHDLANPLATTTLHASILGRKLGSSRSAEIDENKRKIIATAGSIRGKINFNKELIKAVSETNKTDEPENPKALIQGCQEEIKLIRAKIFEDIATILKAVTELEDIVRKITPEEKEASGKKEAIDESINYILDGINRVRKLANIQEQEKIERVNVREFIHEEIRFLASTKEKPRMRIIIDDPQALDFEIDLPANAISRILYNVFRNIEKHANAKQVYIRVTVKNLRPGEQVLVIDIEDDGKGLKQGAPQQDETNCGIGLRSIDRICQRFNFLRTLVDASTSKTRSGALFSLTIPLPSKRKHKSAEQPSPSSQQITSTPEA